MLLRKAMAENARIAIPCLIFLIPQEARQMNKEGFVGFVRALAQVLSHVLATAYGVMVDKEVISNQLQYSTDNGKDLLTTGKILDDEARQVQCQLIYQKHLYRLEGDELLDHFHETLCHFMMFICFMTEIFMKYGHRQALFNGITIGLTSQVLPIISSMPEDTGFWVSHCRKDRSVSFAVMIKILGKNGKQLQKKTATTTTTTSRCAQLWNAVSLLLFIYVNMYDIDMPNPLDVMQPERKHLRHVQTADGSNDYGGQLHGFSQELCPFYFPSESMATDEQITYDRHPYLIPFIVLPGFDKWSIKSYATMMRDQLQLDEQGSRTE